MEEGIRDKPGRVDNDREGIHMSYVLGKEGKEGMNEHGALPMILVHSQDLLEVEEDNWDNLTDVERGHMLLRVEGEPGAKAGSNVIKNTDSRILKRKI